MEGVPRPVDDGLQQLVPCSGGRREAGDVIDEPELVELVGLRGSHRSRIVVGGSWSAGNVHHLDKGRNGSGFTRLRDGCGLVALRPGRWRAPGRSVVIQ
jgi:hypothetical protein